MNPRVIECTLSCGNTSNHRRRGHASDHRQHLQHVGDVAGLVERVIHSRSEHERFEDRPRRALRNRVIQLAPAVVASSYQRQHLAGLRIQRNQRDLSRRPFRDSDFGLRRFAFAGLDLARLRQAEFFEENPLQLRNGVDVEFLAGKVLNCPLQGRHFSAEVGIQPVEVISIDEDAGMLHARKHGNQGEF